MTNPRAETRNNSDKGKEIGALTFSGVTWGKMQPCQKKKGGDELGKRLAALSNPAWSYELAAQDDRILAAWVMAPPIFFIGILRGEAASNRA